MAMLRNQVSELLWYGEIETTLDRAKEVRRLAEKYITLAIRSYQDEVKVTKTKTNAKGEKVEVEFVNDGAKKLAARRRLGRTPRFAGNSQGQREQSGVCRAHQGRQSSSD